MDYVIEISIPQVDQHNKKLINQKLKELFGLLSINLNIQNDNNLGILCTDPDIKILIKQKETKE